MKPIATYKEHKEKPYEQVQGLGRALAYGGLDYIFNLLKNDEVYSEELEDSIIGIEAYVNEREKEIERLNKENKELDKACARKSHYIDKKDLEIGRLNNIINNLINYIGQEWYCFDNESVEFYVAKDILNKLQELKGVDKE